MTDSQTAGSGELHRVTVNLSPRAWDAANETASLLGLNRTDVIDRAVRAYAWLERETANGGAVLVRSASGDVERVKFL